MSVGPSLLSLTAATLYAVVTLTCIIAGLAALRRHQTAWHLRCWLAIAMLFAVFAVLRLVDFEDLFRDQMRDMLRSSGSYSDRRKMQGPVLVVVLFVVAVTAGLVLRWLAPLAKGRRNLAVLASAGATSAVMLLLALRLLSYGPLDRILYGPLKPHWIIDLGSASSVLVCAIFYAWLVRRET